MFQILKKKTLLYVMVIVRRRRQKLTKLRKSLKIMFNNINETKKKSMHIIFWGWFNWYLLPY